MSSERIDQLDAQAEVFYRRLMSKVDDHGLYDARPSMLRATLYPLRVDRVREADISRWMAICQKAGLIVFYEAGGKPFLHMLDTGWEKRSKPKYPLPPVNGCKQPETTESIRTVVVVGDVVEDVDESPAAGASLDPWRFGKDYLVRAGTVERQAKSLIGMWIKQSDKTTVVKALQNAMDIESPDPVSYITAYLQNRPKNQKFDPVAYNLATMKGNA